MKKKVLICVPSLGICNGVTTVIMSFYDYLLEHNYIVDFLLVTDKNLEMEPYVLGKGSKVYKVPKGKKYDKKRIQYMNEVFCKGHYDIVHVNFPGPNGALVLKLAKKNGVKYRVYHCHNPLNMTTLKSALSESVFTPICRHRANKYLACSKAAGKSVFKRNKFQVINNAINPNDFIFDSEARNRLREQYSLGNKLVIGVAARIEEQKNPYFVVKVYEAIRKMREDTVLLWVGDGSMMSEIREFCHQKGMEQSVLMVGRQANVSEWYSAMDLFLLPSRFEGLGIVYLEAQANGLVCFGSECVPDETEITGLMHRISLKKSADEWARMILEVFEAQQKKHYVDISMFQQKDFDIRYTKDRLYNVYESYFREA